jgi:phage antirepressor YoqD-like protein
MTDFELTVQAEVERRLSDPKFLQAKVSDLLAKLQKVQPKLESHDALMASENTMSITNASKHFYMMPRKHVMPYMREHDILTLNELPTADAIELDILVLRESFDRNNNVVRKQSMVEVRQLERWRTYLVPRIQKWVEEKGL